MLLLNSFSHLFSLLHATSNLWEGMLRFSMRILLETRRPSFVVSSIYNKANKRNVLVSTCCLCSVVRCCCVRLVRPCIY